MENHDCRKSQFSHFFKNKSTLWLHDLTLAQHPTVKAAAIFRDKFCLIGFVIVIGGDFYSLLFEFHDEGITISCFVLDDKKSVYGAKGQLRQRVQRVEVSHLSGAPAATTSNLIPSYAYSHFFHVQHEFYAKRHVSYKLAHIPKIILAKIICGPFYSTFVS